MANIADQFKGLPIEDLIVSPLVGMAKGQAKLNEVTWRYIKDVAFQGKGKTRELDIEINKVMTDPNSGEQSWVTHYAKVPMLPLVPLPALAVKTADITFDMEVQTSNQTTSSTDTETDVSVSASGGWFGMKYSASMSTPSHHLLQTSSIAHLFTYSRTTLLGHISFDIVVRDLEPSKNV